MEVTKLNKIGVELVSYSESNKKWILRVDHIPKCKRCNDQLVSGSLVYHCPEQLKGWWCGYRFKVLKYICGVSSVHYDDFNMHQDFHGVLEVTPS